MNKVHAWLQSHWGVPTISVLLILASLAASRSFEAAPLWGDVLMIAAAVVAGAPVVVKAWRALTAKVIGIDLLVSIAAIGAGVNAPRSWCTSSSQIS